MKLYVPNSDRAVIAPGKITDYLLSFQHREGRAKAVFFTRFGFTLADGAELAAALARHVLSNRIQKEEESPYGTRYIVSGPLETPDGRDPVVKSVWFVDWFDPRPRLITAYPDRRGSA